MKRPAPSTLHRRPPRAGPCAYAAITALVLPLAVSADYLDDIGYTALAARPGISLPDGAAIRIDQVEASTGNDPESPVYRPDPASPAFTGVTFIDQTAGPNPAYSSHATSMAMRFAGDADMTPGVATIDNYEAGDWIAAVLYGDFANFNPPRPLTESGTLANHSWVGTTGNALSDADALTRLDFLVDSEDYVQVVGATATGQRLLAQAHNAIAVVGSGRPFTGNSAALDSFYPAGRPVPHLAAPLSSTSQATAVVTAAVALLRDAAPGDTLPAEVVRALLMAGADWLTRNTGGADLDHWQPTGTNGSDPRYGAGQLNIAHSYDLLVGGEQNSLEDGGGNAAEAGYDYDEGFGGAIASNATATYPLGPLAANGVLRAALSWHGSVVDAAGPFAPQRDLYDLQLSLYDVSGGGSAMVATSTSAASTSEIITVPVAAGQDYELRVTHAEPAPFNHDYALAWRIEADRDGDGWPDRFEPGTCPSADDADSDDDGISDAMEDINLDGTVDAEETDPCDADSDGDGLMDGTEQGLTAGVPDPDGNGPLLGTDSALFIADEDPLSTTDPTASDSDGDGFDDGAEDINANGRIDAGESDPADPLSTPPAATRQVPSPPWAALLLGVLLAIRSTCGRSR